MLENVVKRRELVHQRTALYKSYVIIVIVSICVTDSGMADDVHPTRKMTSCPKTTRSQSCYEVATKTPVYPSLSSGFYRKAKVMGKFIPKWCRQWCTRWSICGDGERQKGKGSKVMSRGQGRCTSFSLLDVCVLESQQLVTLKGRKKKKWLPLQFPVSIFLFFYFLFLVGEGFISLCVCVFARGRGWGRECFKSILFTPLAKVAFRVWVSVRLSLFSFFLFWLLSWYTLFVSLEWEWQESLPFLLEFGGPLSCTSLLIITSPESF